MPKYNLENQNHMFLGVYTIMMMMSKTDGVVFIGAADCVPNNACQMGCVASIRHISHNI